MHVSLLAILLFIGNMGDMIEFSASSAFSAIPQGSLLRRCVNVNEIPYYEEELVLD